MGSGTIFFWLFALFGTSQAFGYLPSWVCLYELVTALAGGVVLHMFFSVLRGC